MQRGLSQGFGHSVGHLFDRKCHQTVQDDLQLIKDDQ